MDGKPDARLVAAAAAGVAATGLLGPWWQAARPTVVLTEFPDGEFPGRAVRTEFLRGAELLGSAGVGVVVGLAVLTALRAGRVPVARGPDRRRGAGGGHRQRRAHRGRFPQSAHSRSTMARPSWWSRGRSPVVPCGPTAAAGCSPTGGWSRWTGVGYSARSSTPGRAAMSMSRWWCSWPAGSRPPRSRFPRAQLALDQLGRAIVVSDGTALAVDRAGRVRPVAQDDRLNDVETLTGRLAAYEDGTWLLVRLAA